MGVTLERESVPVKRVHFPFHIILGDKRNIMVELTYIGELYKILVAKGGSIE